MTRDHWLDNFPLGPRPAWYSLLLLGCGVLSLILGLALGRCWKSAKTSDLVYWDVGSGWPGC